MRYGIAALVIAFLFIIGAVVVIGRGNRVATSNNAPSSRITKLADYAGSDSASVSLTTQGKLVGEDQRKAIRITVTKSKRVVEVLDGYEQRVLKSTEQPNTAESFANFTRALDRQNFGKERNVPTPDDRGMCPLGNRYIYRLTDGATEIMRTWSTSCSKAEGPFAGTNPSLIRQLFSLQITDYNKFTSGVKL